VRVRHLWPLLVALAGCSGDGDAAPDAGVDALGLPDASPRDAGVSLGFVDFAAAGCESFDATLVRCRGRAPLELRFVALAAAPLEAYLWSFGDGSPQATSASPVHRYELPGSYGVRLTVGGPGGTVQAAKETYVTVDPVGLGGRCDLEGQCDVGLGCLEGLGLCTRDCEDDEDCGAGATCAILGEDQVCLPACHDGCCQEVRAAEGGWTEACIPAGLFADEGGSCRDGEGALADERCASGSCDDLGARGICAGSCDGVACPSYAVCATFAGNVKRCLAECSEARPCQGDPWLACEAANASGALGFSVASAGGPYCAPRRCAVPADCGPDGTCTAGFCGGL
jgi:PKD repeat protein